MLECAHMPMRILILDDDPHRHEVFDHVYKGHAVVHAHSYFKFLDELLAWSPWDLVHLDHDLGDLHTADTYVDGWGSTREYNGVHASLRICELDDGSLPRKVIIQSVNPEGARAMRANLQRRGVHVVWEPFGEPAAELDDQRVDPGSMKFM